MPHHACRGQRIACRNQLSLSTMDEFPGSTRVVSLGDKCFYLLSHLAGSHLDIKYGHLDIKYPLRPSSWGRKSLLHTQHIL